MGEIVGKQPAEWRPVTRSEAGQSDPAPFGWFRARGRKAFLGHHLPGSIYVDQNVRMTFCGLKAEVALGRFCTMLSGSKGTF